MDLEPSSLDEASDLELSSGALLWRGGVAPETQTGFWGAAVSRLVTAPAEVVEEGIPGTLDLLQQTAAQIVGSLNGWSDTGGLELRYEWSTSTRKPNPLSFNVIGRALGQSAILARQSAAQIVRQVTSLFPPDFAFESIGALAPLDLDGWVEVERVQEVRQPAPWVSPSLASFYYLIHSLDNNGSGWQRLPQLLSDLDFGGAVSIALLPTELTEDEQIAIARICGLSAYLAESRQEPDYFGNNRLVPGDAAAAETRDSWRRFQGSSNGVLVRVGVAAPVSELASLGSVVGSIVTQHQGERKNDAVAARYSLFNADHFSAWRTANSGLVFPSFRHPVWQATNEHAPFSLARLPYFFTLEDAASLLVLPVPGPDGVPGINRSRPQAGRRSQQRESPLGQVPIGRRLHLGSPGRVASLSLRSINRHVLVAGVSGFGKTTTVQTILADLWLNHDIPFMVIEPTKTEYRGLLEVPEMADSLEIYTLGRDDVSPFRLNPLEIPAGMQRDEYANAALAAIKAAIPLPVPLPQIVDEAIDLVYSGYGWAPDAVSTDGYESPMLRDLRPTFAAALRSKGYERQVESNLDAMFGARISSLLRGLRGRMLDVRKSFDFSALRQRPVVIELDGVHDSDDKAILSALLLARLRAVARASGSSGGELRHVTVVEEAHRLLGLVPAADRSETGSDPRASAVSSFAEAVAEMRALGEGFVLSSNEPSRLVSTAIANCSTRIIHRLSGADRELLLDDIDGSVADRRLAARLQEREVLVSGPDFDDPELVLIDAFDGVDTSRRVADLQVREHMQKVGRERI